MSHIPPPSLASTRVLAYAMLDRDVVYTGVDPVFVAGREIGQVPRLAIGRALGGPDILLLRCAADWDVLAVSTHASIDDAKAAAERAYSGVSGRWQPASFTDAELEAFLDEEDRGHVCSFCGRHPHEVDRIITGHRGAAICEICIRAMRQRMTPES
jgi:hypothetical protein